MSLRVCTVATRPNLFLAQLSHSCKHNSIELHVLGAGRPFLGYAMKFLLVQEYLNTLDDNDVLLFVDANDVLILSKPEEILNNFLSFETPLVVSAEKFCHPEKELQANYPESPTPYRFVNSGTYIGYVGFLKRVFKDLSPIQAEDNDQSLLTHHFLKHSTEYKLDTSCKIFLTTYKLPQELIHLDVSAKRVSCLETNTTPQVIHANAYRHYYQLIFDRFFGTPDFREMKKVKQDKSLFLAVHARDDAPVLPKYLRTLEEFDYDKKLITLYIRTYNNRDSTKEILDDWVAKNSTIFKKIIYNPEDCPTASEFYSGFWMPARYKIEAEIRNDSLKAALKENCDYYFSVDCDNFLHKGTLQDLMSQKKPIIAPFIWSLFESECIRPLGFTPQRDENTTHGVLNNFFGSIDAQGRFQPSLEHFEIITFTRLGVFEVPVVFGSLLVESQYLPKLQYIDTEEDSPFLAFARSARNSHIPQYICNDADYGVCLYLSEYTMQPNQEAILKAFLNNA